MYRVQGSLGYMKTCHKHRELTTQCIKDASATMAGLRIESSLKHDGRRGLKNKTGKFLGTEEGILFAFPNLKQNT